MPSADSKTESLELLLKAGLLLSSKLDLSDLLHSIMELGARIVNAQTASLLLVDPKTDELYFDVALGLDPELASVRLKMGQGIAGSVAQSAKPLIINDVARDPRWSPGMDESSGFTTRSILAAPICIRGRCIGVVEAINHMEGDFSEDDLRVLESFASQAAVAIENARLFASLQEEKTKLATLLNEMRDAAVLADPAGRILVANEAARRYFSAGGRDPETLADTVRGLKLTPALEAVAASPEPVVAFEAVREEPKRLVLSGTASLLRGGDGSPSGRVVVFRDVTEERQEEMLKRSFLSLISHKFKTPLSSINGYSHILMEDAQGLEDFHKKALRTIHDQGVKLNELVQKLLNYTVMETLDASETERRPFPLREPLKEALDALGPWLGEQAAEVSDGVPEGLKAVGDPVLVREALKNLIENAAKFAPPGRRRVAVTARAVNGSVEVRVEDQGPGIPPEELDRVFQKFHQVESSFTGQVEGWGLGLSYVRKVVERLGGSVRVDSRLGRGSTFTVVLPAG